MARVQVKSQSWGVFLDRISGGARGGETPQSFTGTVYAGASGATEIELEDWTTDLNGELPGYVERGTYVLVDPDGNSFTVEATLGLVLVLVPENSTQNVVQASGAGVRPFTIRRQGTDKADLLRLEDADGTFFGRFGYGGIDTEVEGQGPRPNLLLITEHHSAGVFAVQTEGGEHEAYFGAGNSTILAEGPHFIQDMGIGMAESTYMYCENMVVKQNRNHLFTSGVESFSATEKHYFLSNVTDEDPFTYGFPLSIDRATGRLIVNADPDNLPADYNALFTFRAETGQDIVRWVSNAEAILARIDKSGYFMTRKTAAPADGDLVAGELAIWFDPTNSAAKIKFKAKETGGTVRAGEVALA